MSYIGDMNDFVRLIHSYEEVILLPLGSEGRLTLEFLRYSGFIERICCIATDRVDNVDDTLQAFDHFLPLVPFEYLLHFRESALIVAAVPSKVQKDFDVAFTSIGFKNFFFLNSVALKQIQDSLQQLLNSGQALAWFMSYVTREITDLKYRIAEQNEVRDTNTKAFAEYRNAFRGKKVVLFASGPTAKYYKPIADAIHVGVNFSWRREDIPLNYLFTADAKINFISEIKFKEGINKVHDRVFVGMYLPRGEYLRFSEDHFTMGDKVRRFYFVDDKVDQYIYQNICYHPPMCFSTIAQLALHFILFTYPKEIYLVGCDTSPTGHFYDKSNSAEQLTNKGMSTKTIKVGYARIKMFTRHYYPDTEIISINPVGLRGLFSDVYTKDYLASLKDGN